MSSPLATSLPEFRQLDRESTAAHRVGHLGMTLLIELRRQPSRFERAQMGASRC